MFAPPGMSRTRIHIAKVTIHRPSNSIWASCTCGWKYNPPIHWKDSHRVKMAVAHARAHRRLNKATVDVVSSL